jgi:hypothetical protein
MCLGVRENTPAKDPEACLPDPKDSAGVNKKDLSPRLRCDKSTTDEVVFLELTNIGPNPLVLLGGNDASACLSRSYKPHVFWSNSRY